MKLVTAEHIGTKRLTSDPLFGHITVLPLCGWSLWLIVELVIPFPGASLLGVHYASGMTVKVRVSLLWAERLVSTCVLQSQRYVPTLYDNISA